MIDEASQNVDKSETVTEGIFRDFYGIGTFIEKSAIPSSYGFKSKNKTHYKGYPDFFRDNVDEDFVIVVEAKADDYKRACKDVCYYARNNKIDKDIVAISIAGLLGVGYVCRGDEIDFSFSVSEDC